MPARQKGSCRGTALLILNLGTICSWMDNVTLRPPYHPRQRAPVYIKVKAGWARELASTCLEMKDWTPARLAPTIVAVPSLYLRPKSSG
jgi:hypothetical protein